MIRRLEQSFELQGPHGTHEVFVFPPLGLSLRAFQDMMPDHIFAKSIDVGAIQRVLPALDFLPGPANLSHTGKAALRQTVFCISKLQSKIFMRAISSSASTMSRSLRNLRTPRFGDHRRGKSPVIPQLMFLNSCWKALAHSISAILARLVLAASMRGSLCLFSIERQRSFLTCPGVIR